MITGSVLPDEESEDELVSDELVSDESASDELVSEDETEDAPSSDDEDELAVTSSEADTSSSCGQPINNRKTAAKINSIFFIISPYK